LLLEAGLNCETGIVSETPPDEYKDDTESRMAVVDRLTVKGDVDRTFEKKLEDYLEAEAILLLTPKSLSRTMKHKQIRVEIRKLRLRLSNLR
jgi:hypothetical protein